MLDGKEVSGQIGSFGQYFVDVSDVGTLEVGLSLKIDIIAELRKLAAKSSNKLDDGVVDIIAHLLKPA